jgi:sugar-specific transcriptional regulator TrmB
MSHDKDRAVELLRDLGLNQLEAEVYAHLLATEPATAYGVGTALGRPTANVYKAIERLARLGAVLVEEGSSRVCRAVPAAEFLRHTERAFREKTEAAGRALASLRRESFDERVYRVESVAEVLERARQMLAEARRVAVLDAFPRSLAALEPALREAARRGVDVYVEAYAAADIEGAHVVVVPEGARAVAAWRSEQLNLVIDGREHLMALLGADLREVYQAVWSRSVYLSCLQHAGRLTEHTLARLLVAARDRPADDPLAQIVRTHPFFRDSDVPGHRELVRRFATPEGEPPPEDPA